MCGNFYVREKNTIMERLKFVCTQADMIILKDRMQKKDIIDICTRERNNTIWKFYKRTILTIFASLPKDVPMDCKGTSYLNHCSKTIMWIVLLFREIPDNPTLTISVCLEH